MKWWNSLKAEFLEVPCRGKIYIAPHSVIIRYDIYTIEFANGFRWGVEEIVDNNRARRIEHGDETSYSTEDKAVGAGRDWLLELANTH